jgi:hypothetical protein
LVIGPTIRTLPVAGPTTTLASKTLWIASQVHLDKSNLASWGIVKIIDQCKHLPKLVFRISELFRSDELLPSSEQ